PRGQERLKEAAKRGFRVALGPKANAPRQAIQSLEIWPVDRIDASIERVRRRGGPMARIWTFYVAPGLRSLQRDWRSGELALLALALLLAVTAVCSVGFLSDRVSAALDRSSAQMLGGDLVLRADEPIAREVLDQAAAFGLDVSLYRTLSSMASSRQGMRLVSLKAVDAAYPLRGEVLLRDEVTPQGRAAASGPSPQSVWIDPQLTSLLGVQVGDTIELGETALRVEGVIAYEPDRGVQFINVAPRVMMRLDELAATGLLGPASRVRDVTSFAGPQQAVAAYRQWLEPRLERGQRLSEPGEEIGRAHV